MSVFKETCVCFWYAHGSRLEWTDYEDRAKIKES